MGGNRNNAVGCCEPVASAVNTYYVKMDTDHNPSYYLVNRRMPDDARVSLQADLDDVGAIFFANEHQAQVAINLYIQYHSERGVKVQGVDYTAKAVVHESQVMEFV